MRSIALILLAFFLPAPSAAQNADKEPDRVRRRFSLVLEAGYSFGGPGAGLEEQLRQAGFDDASQCFIFCTGSIEHPTREKPGPVAGFVARYAVNGTVTVGAGYGHTSLGGATGYQADANSAFGHYIFSDWDATMFWSGVFWTPDASLRLGAGPGWYQLENPPENLRVSKIGLMAEVGLEEPLHGKIYLNMAIRAHLIPTKDIEHGSSVPLTLRPRWTHVALMAGIGVHL